MKIQCQSCQAKYTIADEKVLGKVVKIRCKKCSATIVINGNETRPAEETSDAGAFDYAGQSGDPWTVNVADGDQRTMTLQEVVTEYKAGTVNDETYCWKDGMPDWLPLREIEALYGAARAGGQSIAEDLSIPPQPVQPSSPPVASAPVASGAGGGLFGGSESKPVDSPFAGAAHTNGNGAGALFGGGAEAPAAAASPAAARRGGGRGQGADLFSGAAAAGGDEDVMTSAAKSGGGAAAAAAQEEQKLTGQRNESSVLFSLSALTEGKKPAEQNRTTATQDGSGLIDIRALSQNMAGDEKKDKGSRVDDIMNLSGGGAFGAALAAPILAPPPMEAVDLGTGTAAAAPNKTMLFAILGGAALIAVGIVVAVVLTRSPAPEASQTAPSAAVPTAEPSAAALAHNDPAPTAAPTQDNTPPPPGLNPVAPSGKAGGKPAAGGKAPAGGGGAAAAAPAAGGGAAEAPVAAAPAPAKPADFGSALAAAAGKPASDAPKAGGGGGSTAPFDRGAAAGALGNVNIQSCKQPGGPTGSGHVKVTFAPDGNVSAAVIDGGPYPGTPVGGCIAGKYRGAHIPAFSGAPVSVGKSFTLN